MDPLLHLTLRASLALLLGSAAAHKWRDPERFREAFAAYEIFSRARAARLAVVVPLVEATLAFALASGIFVELWAFAAALLLLAYTGALALNLLRGRRDIDCGCMGPAASVPLSPLLLLRNLLVASAALLLVLPPEWRELGLLDFAVAGLATSALAACWLASERLLALAPRAAALREKVRRGERHLHHGEPR